ncbi:MAG: phenylalanine--tRNA ligase subunit alpha [Candidatus Dormibacteraeota bacterium]|nr:phenylalanine--tRNA ligase subunit alpha [Candidatus Dormibacteraeota bacterium]
MTGDHGLDPEKTGRAALQQQLEAIAAAPSEESLEDMRVQFLGRRSPLARELAAIGGLPAAERRQVGALLNQVKVALQEALDARREALRNSGAGTLGAAEAIDLTFPGAPPRRGHAHPVTRVWREIEDIFRGLGYEIARGPEVESDYYSFEALNMPAGHPARDGFDTFFLTADDVRRPLTGGSPPGPQADGAGAETGVVQESRVLLRPHTSPMQIRYMEEHPPPLRVIIPGKTYRRDNDATHVPMFHQVEGLLVDEGVTVADLKGTLEYFARAMFGNDRRIRLRPDHFPFTEPSLEVHVSCMQCNGSGCPLCRHSGWIEILGSGMVHPNVLRSGGIDPQRYTGFAFGCGIDRVAMLKYGIDDLRSLFENDVRMIRQF